MILCHIRKVKLLEIQVKKTQFRISIIIQIKYQFVRAKERIQKIK